MKAGCYAIEHMASGRLYIGSSTRLRVRLRSHLDRLRHNIHSNPHLQRAWMLYGEDAFVFRPILWCAPADLLFFEQRLIDGLKVCDRASGYNVRSKAESNAGIPTSAAQRAAISAMMRDPHRSRNVRAAARVTMASPERVAQSLAQLTKIRTDPDIQARRIANTVMAIRLRCAGSTTPDETRKKQSAAAKRRCISGNKNTRKKLSDAQALAIFRDARPARAVARDYGLNKSTVLDIRRGRIWGHITGGQAGAPQAGAGA